MAEIQKMTGFPSACTEYAEDRLSLDQRYLTHPSAMYPVKVSNDAKIFDLKKGDYLIVDRSLTPKPGDLVLAVIANEFCFAIFAINGGAAVLLPHDKKAGENELGEDFVWGVVSSQHRSRV